MNNLETKINRVLISRAIGLTILSMLSLGYYFYNDGSILKFITLIIIIKVFGSIGSIGYHRWVSHNAFSPSSVGRALMYVGMLLSALGKPLQYAHLHRSHHAYTDTEKDPHSPANLTFFELLIGKMVIVQAEVPIMRRDKGITHFNKYYWHYYVLMNLCLAIIDIQLALIICPASFLISKVLVTYVNYFAHKKLGGPIGLRNLGRWLSPLVSGEELHKNHHENPTSYDFGGNGRWDLGARMIELFLRKKVS